MVHHKIILSVKRVDFVSDRISYIDLRGRWCNTIVLNVHTPRQAIRYDSKHNSCEELEQVFDHFPKYNLKIFLGDFNTKFGREDIFKPTIWNESLHQDSNDSSIRITNFATSKILVVKSMMFPHRNFHKYTWTSPDGKTHNQIDHMMDWR